MREQLEKLRQERTLLELAHFNENLLRDKLNFYSVLSHWVVSTLSPSSLSPEPSENLTFMFPFTESTPIAFMALPEYYLSDVSDYIISCAKNNIQVLDDPCFNHIVSCFTVYMTARASGFIKNPYLIARCIEALFVLIPPEQPRGAIPFATLDNLKNRIISNR